MRTIAAVVKKADEVRAAMDRAMPPATRARVLTRARRIARIVSDPAFQDAFARIQADAEQLMELYDEWPVAFVVDRLEPVIGAQLLRADPDERDVLMLALLEQALLEPPHLDQVDRAVRQTPVLGEPQREDLLAAIRMLRERPTRWASACRLLLGGYEGALWLWAQHEDVIDEKRNVINRPPGKTGFAKGVDRILDDDGLSLPDDHRRFVRQGVFDALANDIRHGRAKVGHRECALVVLFALDAWLDQQVGSRLREDASGRINRIANDVANQDDERRAR